MTSVSANAGLLPERVKKAAQERIDAGTYQTLVFGVVDGDKVEIMAFGTRDDGTTPDGDTVYEIGSITKTFTATLLAQEVLSGGVTLERPVARLLPDFKIPSRGGREITLGELATQHSGLPRLPSNLLPRYPANPYADYDASKLKAFLAEYQLPRDPGASYEYSGLNSTSNATGREKLSPSFCTKMDATGTRLAWRHSHEMADLRCGASSGGRLRAHPFEGPFWVTKRPDRMRGLVMVRHGASLQRIASAGLHCAHLRHTRFGAPSRNNRKKNAIPRKPKLTARKGVASRPTPL